MVLSVSSFNKWFYQDSKYDERHKKIVKINRGIKNHHV